MNKLPDKLTRLRKHYGYSQSVLADYLNIDVVNYMGFENGRIIPSFETIRRLAKFYDITVDSLFVNDIEPEIYGETISDVDKKNYSYLRNQTWKQQSKEKFHKYLPFLVIALLIVAGLFLIVMNHSDSDITLKQSNVNNRLLAASDTSVVYIDADGNTFGRGDNSNGQLDMHESNAHKVAMGATFSVVLRKDGTVVSYGLLSKYADEIKKWNNIVDIAVGNGFVMALDDSGNVTCVGNNNLEQCKFDGESDVKNIFAENDASFIVKTDDTVKATGSFLAKSKMKTIPPIIDLAISDHVTAYLTKDRLVGYHSSTNNFVEVGSWQDIVDIAVGNEFIAGLDESGHVHIDIQNYKIKDEVESWENILAIAAGQDYLVAFDGKDIKGIGNNSYHQFDVIESQKIVLPSPVNIKVAVDEYNVTVTFDEVPNAAEYHLELNTGIGYAISSTDNKFIIPVEKFEDGQEYILKIIAVGNDNYEDSPPTVTSYRYSAPHKDENEHTDSENNPNDDNHSSEIEIPFTLDLLTGKTRASFEAYLRGFGVLEDKLHPVESGNICTGQEAIIETVEGIQDYETLTKSDLLKRDITYTYCKVEVSHE